MTDDRIDRLEASLERLANKIDEGFARIDVRFEQVDARFEQIDARFERLETTVRDNHREMLVRVEDLRRGQQVLAEAQDAARERGDHHDVRVEGIATRVERLELRDDLMETRVARLESASSRRARRGRGKPRS
jgi:chromosome segregation ATPase